MSQVGWFRFKTAEGVIFGEVQVPSKVPLWFEPTIKAINDASRREITMADIQPEDWLDYLCSSSRPIHLRTPLSLEEREENVAMKQADFKALDATLSKIADSGPDGKAMAIAQANNREWMVSQGVVFQEEIEKIPVDQREQYKVIVPLSTVTGQRGRMFRVLVPVLTDKDDETSYRLYPNIIVDRITVQGHHVQSAAAKYYGKRVQAAQSVPPAPTLAIQGH